MSNNLYLDDVHAIPKDFTGVRNYEEFVEFIKMNGIPELISFDHDLGVVLYILSFVLLGLHLAHGFQSSFQSVGARSLWIGTADIKDLYIKTGLNSTKPFLGALSDLIRNGTEIRLLMAKEPGTNFRNDFDKYPLLIQHLEQAVCPRVHFKFFIFDFREVYVGSANLTGAGLGMKSANNRNFEAGVLTDETQIVERAIAQFDEVWNGSQCANCGRKAFCPCPISKLI